MLSNLVIIFMVQQLMVPGTTCINLTIIFLGMSTEEIHSHHGTSTSGIYYIIYYYSYHENNLARHCNS